MYSMYSVILLSENTCFRILASILEQCFMIQHLPAIEMNPKPCLLSQNIHQFKNCGHLKKIVTFLYNFGHHKHFPPKFQILVVKICIDLTLISNIPKWQNLLHIWPKNGKICQNSFNFKHPKKGYVGPFRP